jgi:protocatechuate 3,4-dioxygenase, alpha subunit
MSKLGLTPSQTVGPFFHYALAPADYPYEGLVPTAIDGAGTVVEVSGIVFDGDGVAVGDALLEFWQADAAGRMQASNAPFQGFARVATSADGVYKLRTILPGSVAGQAPHLNLSVLGRGLLNRLHTRVYFAGQAANDQDKVLALVPSERRGTLIAALEAPGKYRFDIRLQGAAETVFFQV